MTDLTDIAVEAVGLGKSFGDVRALGSVDLTIRSGEYYVLLGPSGGGKTTLLRLFGGFIRPSRGKVLLHGADMSAFPPDKRPTSMVFQSYALFPHMSVAKNVGYGLRLRRMRSADIKNRVEEMLDMVGLAGYGERMPHELSGGQQQRVQLARALVLESDVLLLDEPLAALDAKLRKEMCFELKHLQEKVGITFVHVTHNQEEAMTVADRIAIIADGDLVEEGDSRSIYEAPKRKFTADFIGENNIFDGEVSKTEEDRVTVDLGFASVEVPSRGESVEAGTPISFSVRSERLQLVPEKNPKDQGMQYLPATYLEDVYLGLTTRRMVRLEDGREVTVRAVSDLDQTAELREGDPVFIGWRLEEGRLHLS